MTETTETKQYLTLAIVRAMPTTLGIPTENILRWASLDMLTDTARSLGILCICHGCKTVYTVDPGTPEDARRRSARIYEEMGMLDCCEDANNTIL